MNSLVNKFVTVLIHPWQAMEEVKTEGEASNIKSAMIFVLVMGLISGIITTVWGLIIPPPQVAGGGVSKWSILIATPLVPIVSFLLSFVGAFILWGFVHGLLKGSMMEYK